MIDIAVVWTSRTGQDDTCPHRCFAGGVQRIRDQRQVCSFLSRVELHPDDISSDARTGQVVEERIRPALESGYAVGSSKPVLIVIDEIDGATGDNVSTNVLSEMYIK
jgi:hypothetical protein